MAHLSTFTLPKRIIIIIVSRDFRLSTRCSWFADHIDAKANDMEMYRLLKAGSTAPQS
jgi:hypothetical protein